MTDLVRLLAASAPAELLPPRRSDEADRVEPPLSLVGAAALGPHWYVLVEDARGTRYGVPAVVDGGRLRRAVAGDGVSDALVGLMAAGESRSGGLELTIFHAGAASGERAFEVDQTNDLMRVGDAVVVKWLLHPTDQPQPGPERMRALAEADFGGTPRPWGLVHLAHGEQRTLVATASTYIPQAQDGWDWAVGDVRACALGGLSMSAALEPVRAVGQLVAGMHVALSRAGIDRATDETARLLLEQAESDVVTAGLDGETASRVAERILPLGSCAGTTVIDVHGDLHIGQILRSKVTGAYFVIDFDGSPLAGPDEVLVRAPAARDVAGMLASLDHVGRVVLHRTEGLGTTERGRVLAWIDDAQQAFLDAYRAGLASVDEARLLDEALLLPFQVQQECREYAYAARYLPHWRYVPDAALPALLTRGSR